MLVLNVSTAYPLYAGYCGVSLLIPCGFKLTSTLLAEDQTKSLTSDSCTSTLKSADMHPIKREVIISAADEDEAAYTRLMTPKVSFISNFKFQAQA